MTPEILRAWQTSLGLSLTTASRALGMDRRSYARLLSGESRIDHRTALACSAIAAGLPAWGEKAKAYAALQKLTRLSEDLDLEF